MNQESSSENKPVSLPAAIKTVAALIHEIQQDRDPHYRVLSELLVEHKLINPTELSELQQQLPKVIADKELGLALQERSLISNTDFQHLLAFKLGMPFVNLTEFELDPSLINIIPVEFSREHNLIPILDWKDKLVVAIEDPTDCETTNMLHFITGRILELVVATRADIDYAIAKIYGPCDDADLLEDLEIVAEQGELEDNIQESLKLGQQRPTVRMVHYMILDAIHSRASDIHIRPKENIVDLYFRIDGNLVKIRSFNKNLHSSVASRIKILAGMDIAEHRLPQDGQARMSNRGKVVDLRVSIMPSIHGESVVIRILDTGVGLKTLQEVGFTEKDQELFTNLLSRSCGMILVTGPTGSGKSTTLYATLQKIREQNVNIITVEDPVEYHIDGIVQVQVNHATGYSFARALRHILRHDPDVIMVGEIRDLETAKMAVESSLTGHIVLSTLHTNSAATTITRLIEIGIEPYLVNTSLLAVLAQRLVRCNCPQCTAPEEVNSGMRQALGVSNEEVFFRGRGCDYCHQTGYLGRRAVYELLEISTELRAAIAPGAPSDYIEKIAIEEGMIPLTEQALGLARKKVTSLEEVYRVRLT